jgi:allophanate hydrolase subunit 1|tara:strand:- start:1095 stop:1223 length:129 start_codon:yes stop_codon:yes gene_type:complete
MNEIESITTLYYVVYCMGVFAGGFTLLRAADRSDKENKRRKK